MRDLKDQTRHPQIGLLMYGSQYIQMLYVPIDNRLWESTEALLWQLDRQGKVLPVIDALIAESAKRIGAVILILDPHFQMIPGIIAVDRIV